MPEFSAERFKHLRKSKRLSQKEVAHYVGVSDRAVSKWEKGLSCPSVKSMTLLTRLFNKPLEHFIEESATHNLKDTGCGMESITELYKIGRGPSSSHTIGPEKACIAFKDLHKDADRFKVILYGSLAKTGVGHGTDAVIKKTLDPIECEVIFDRTEENIPHPNTMDLIAFKNGMEIARSRVMSVGGGSIVFEGLAVQKPQRIYTESSFDNIAKVCHERNIRLWQFAEEREDSMFLDYMNRIWMAMKAAVQKGLNDEGVLPGGLGVQKKAKSLFNNQHIDESAETRENRMVCAYAYAVSEQNAAGEHIVTAPTCGAAGVLPAVLYYQQQKHGYSDERIIKALITAGLVGNLIKTNASISGAECGCQAEIGSACAMAAAALCELFELSIDKIEYAAEIAIEHHLGLTCDPICGLVQIPCIERNAVAAMRAINAASLASFLWDSRKISFDRVVQTMKETGHDLSVLYKETSEAGLAKIKILE